MSCMKYAIIILGFAVSSEVIYRCVNRYLRSRKVSQKNFHYRENPSHVLKNGREKFQLTKVFYNLVMFPDQGILSSFCYNGRNGMFESDILNKPSHNVNISEYFKNQNTEELTVISANAESTLPKPVSSLFTDNIIVNPVLIEQSSFQPITSNENQIKSCKSVDNGLVLSKCSNSISTSQMCSTKPIKMSVIAHPSKSSQEDRHNQHKKKNHDSDDLISNKFIKRNASSIGSPPLERSLKTKSSDKNEYWQPVSSAEIVHHNGSDNFCDMPVNENIKELSQVNLDNQVLTDIKFYTRSELTNPFLLPKYCHDLRSRDYDANLKPGDSVWHFKDALLATNKNNLFKTDSQNVKKSLALPSGSVLKMKGNITLKDEKIIKKIKPYIDDVMSNPFLLSSRMYACELNDDDDNNFKGSIRQLESTSRNSGNAHHIKESKVIKEPKPIKEFKIFKESKLIKGAVEESKPIKEPIKEFENKNQLDLSPPHVQYAPLFHGDKILGISTSLVHMIAILESANKTLEVCVMVLTCRELLNSIIRAKNRGVAVRILVDNSMSECSRIAVLQRENIPVLIAPPSIMMHNKFAIIDSNLRQFFDNDGLPLVSNLNKVNGTIMIGSFNWTWSAVISNNETVLITNNPLVVKPLIEEFEHLWKLYS